MIEALKCSQCGAGVAQAASRQEERVCDYCGSVLRLAPVEQTQSGQREYAGEPDYACPKHCPRCHHKTVETRVGRNTVRACHQCGGLWIPRKALKHFHRLSKRDRRDLKQLNRSKLRRSSRPHRTQIGTLHCPRCAHAMTQTLYSQNDTTIAVDVCAEHGAWFDENELHIAHRSIAKKLGRRSSQRKRWNRSRSFRKEWEFGALFILFKLLAEILEEVFD